MNSSSPRVRVVGPLLALILVAGAASTAAATGPEPSPGTARHPAKGRARAGGGELGPLDRVVLTPDGFDTYRLLHAGRSLGVATGDANAGGNLRAVYVQRHGEEATDQQVCATWSEERGVVAQEGLALRVRSDLGEPGQALTVTKSVWGGFAWLINLHLWTGGAKNWRLNLLAQFDFNLALIHDGVLDPLPWRVCTRATGAVIAVKIWPSDQPEPEWDDAVHVQRTLAPASTVRPGRIGWYVGHLRPGDFVRYDAMGTSTRP